MSEHDITAQINAILTSYKKEAQEIADKAAKETAQECADKLKATSPRGPGRRGKHYAEGWTSKKNGGSYVAYNKTSYQLTHLLERSHLIANQYGTYGRSKPIKHIEPVEQWGISEYQRKVNEGLKKI